GRLQEEKPRPALLPVVSRVWGTGTSHAPLAVLSCRMLSATGVMGAVGAGVGGGCDIQSVDLARALIGAEEEKLPGADGAAQSGAELVLLEIGFGLSGSGAEERVGVEHVIAHEFPDVAVIFMLAALGDEGGGGDLRAVDRVVLRSLDLQFRNGVGVGDRAGGEGAVQGVASGAGVAVDVDVARAAPQGAGVVDVGRGAGGHRQD